MAALDRRISILDFVGQSWTSWIDKVDVSTSDGSSLEDYSKNVKKRIETMTLKKEDMSIYGHCPAHDDFFLVVCSLCGQMVKPQAFERHCERRHGPFSKLCGSSSGCSPDRPSSQHGSLCEGQDKRYQETEPPRVPPPHSAQQGRSKPQRERQSLQQVVNNSHGTPPSTHFSAPGPKDPLWLWGSNAPKAPPPAEKPLQKGLNSHTALHGPKTYGKTYKNIHKKECDLDKHCGVMDPEKKKLCTRLLTCNIHSVHQRRQVVGRSKAFDQLVTELKMNSKPRERPPQPREVPDERSAHTETPGSHCSPLHFKNQITNSSVLRSMTSSESVLEMEQKVTCSDGMQIESFSVGFSSEESDDENREDFAHLPASTCHPKPLGLCTFGARVFGRSVLTFDQRLFRLRSAFSVMMEQHLSTYLWKKIPQVLDLCSYQPNVTTNNLNSHDATYSSKPSHKASSLRTSTSGKSEHQPTNQTTPSKLPTKAPSVSGPRHHNFVGRSSKQSCQATFRELQESPTARKRRKSPLEDEEIHGQSKILHARRDRQPSLARTAITSPHGPLNGTLSPSSKPHPSVYASEIKVLIKQSPTCISHSPPPESDKGGASGINQRPLGYEHKGRKRKTSGASPPKNSSCVPKSSLVSWGADGGPGLPKKLCAQKPKLLH